VPADDLALIPVQLSNTRAGIGVTFVRRMHKRTNYPWNRGLEFYLPTALVKGVERYVKSRLAFAIPDDVLMEASNSIAKGFEDLPITDKTRQQFIVQTPDGEVFELWRLARNASDSDLPRSERAMWKTFYEQTQAADRLLFSALNAVWEWRKSIMPERPAGFASRFLKARPSGPSALFNETLVDPKRFQGLRSVEASIRYNWLREVPATLEGRLLRCEYLPAAGESGYLHVKMYWYHSMPKNWSSVGASLSRSHPLIADVAPQRQLP